MLADTIRRIEPLDARAMAAMQARLDALAKPPGSLGRLEALAVQLAGISGRVPPACDERAVFVFAADHGVAAEGVSAYPAEVTRQMVLNFLAGGAAINVLARQAGARLIVVDAGVAGDLPGRARLPSSQDAHGSAGASPSRHLGSAGASPSHLKFVSRKIARGTQNFIHAPAMTRDDALRSVELGIASFEPCQAAALGEMGIGNSTSAAAIVAAATGCTAAAAAGPGTGVDAAGRQRKIAAIQRALALHQPDAGDGLALLSAVGGFEIGALAGAMLAAAAARVPAVIDGFISTAAALVAVRICPAVREYLIAAHVSAEPGHPLALADLGLRPLLQLDMRLGEGTGAVLAFHLLDAACRVSSQMATFDEAQVSRRQP